MTRARGLTLVAMALVALGACSPGGSTRAPEHAASSDAQPVGPSGGESIYDLDLELADADGRRARLADLRDTVRVAAMMYTRCTSVCPRVTHDMQAIEAGLSGRDLEEVGFVLFSLDPGRDSSQALRRYAAGLGLDRRRWRLFSASEDGVRDLAAVLGVKYRREESGEFAHSAMIFVIDRRGVVRHQQVGFGADARELVTAVRSAR